jgi:DNA-nicking Smr family endonuclease
MRRLGPDEARLWAKVVESVRPLGAAAAPPAAPEEAPPPPAAARPRSAPPPPAPAPRKGHGETLDAGWDRRLARGLVAPDASLDLHGRNLATAYDLLDRRLEQAVLAGARVLLLITGKPRSGGTERRGAIRAAVGDWLAASRHAGDIAAVRNAHPRHGGAGALYIILRRRRKRS